MLNGFEDAKLFSKEVPVTVKDVCYPNQNRKLHLLLTMEWKEVSMYNGKVLKITLTDNDDLYFLYNLEMSEEDFHTLKASQGLLIHFSAFPPKIIDYIGKCLCEEHEPKYSLVFTANDKSGHVAVQPHLDIIETNQFKLLTHLSLNFFAPPVTVLRQYQNTVYKQLQENKKQLQREVDTLKKDNEDMSANYEERFNSQKEENKKLKKKHADELSKKESTHQRELQEERERITSRYKDEIDRLEKEIKTKDYNFRMDIQQFESRVNALTTLNRELQDKIREYESTITELRSKVLSLEDEKNHLKENLQSYKRKHDHLLSEFNDKQLHLEVQEEKLCDLQQKFSCKEQHVLKLKDRIETELEHKKSLENKYEDIKFRLDMCEKQRKALEVDKERLNDVIISLQDEIKGVKNEGKSLNHVVAKHKKTVEEKDMALLDAKQEISDLNITLQVKNAELKNISDSNHKLYATIEDLKKELQEKGNMIKYLNRQMTETGVIPIYTPPSHLLSPTTIAEKELAKINSQRPKNSPPLLTGKSAASKSVRNKFKDPKYLSSGNFIR